MCSNLFVLLFLVTPCIVVAVQSCMEWIPIKKNGKGNPNYQGILNWILQILHYHCSKQHKNIENLLFIKQNIVISCCRSLCLLRLVLPSSFWTADIFQFLDTVLCDILNVTSYHLWRSMKSCVYNNFKVYSNLSQVIT